MNARITRRFYEHMGGSQAWFDPAEEAFPLLQRIRTVRPRKDGSRHVNLTHEEGALLLEYAEGMALGASQNVSFDDPDSTADLRSARAQVRILAGLVSHQ